MRKLQVGDKVKDGEGREGVVVLTDLLGSYPIACRMVNKRRTVETLVTYTSKGYFYLAGDKDDYYNLDLSSPWDNIPIDAKVLVWNNGDNGDNVKFCRHFAGVGIEGKPMTWVDGLTSFTSGDVKHPYFVWDNCELYKGEE